MIVFGKVIYNGSELLELGVAKQLFHYIRTLWYLYATFFSAIIIGLVNKYFSGFKSDVILVFIAICLHILPTDTFWIQFAYVFILVGYFARKYLDDAKKVFENKKSCKNIILFMITAVYLILLIWFKYDYSVYVSGSNLLTNGTISYQIFVNTFRFFMGIFGTVVVYVFLNFCYKRLVQFHIVVMIVNFVEKIGCISLEMYVTQWVVVEIIFAYVMQNVLINFGEVVVSNSYVCYFFWRNIIGAMMTLITYVVCNVLKTTTLGKYIY